LKVGPVISSVTDDTINRILLTWSLEAEDKADDNGITVDRDAPQDYVVNFVMWGTAVQLLNMLLIQGAYSGGTKRLGDLSISKNYDFRIIDLARKDAIIEFENAKQQFRSPRDYAELSKNDPRRHPPSAPYFGRVPKKLNQQRGRGPWYKRGGSRLYELVQPYSETDTDDDNDS
jgi:hypothetical protein